MFLLSRRGGGGIGMGGPLAWGHEATDTGFAYAPVPQAHGHHHSVQCFALLHCSAHQTSSVAFDCALALAICTPGSARTHHPPTVPVSL